RLDFARAELPEQPLGLPDPLGLGLRAPRELELVRAVELEALGLILNETDQRPRIDVRALAEAQRAPGGTGLQLRGAELLREELQPRNREQRLRRRRQQPEPVDQLDLQLIELVARRRVRNPLVVHETRVHVRHVVLGDQRRQPELDLGAVRERILEIRLPSFLQLRDRTREELVVEREADRLNLPALAFAEQLARAAILEVVRRERDAGSEPLERLDRLEPFRGARRQGARRRRDHVRIGLMVRAADAAAELVQLREAQAVRAVDDDRVRGRNVDAALDDRRAHEHVEAPVVEVEHDLLERALGHLSV